MMSNQYVNFLVYRFLHNARRNGQARHDSMDDRTTISDKQTNVVP